jgi:LCCL domain
MASSHLRLLCACAAIASVLAVRVSAHPQAVVRDGPTRPAEGGAPGRTALPLSPDAQRLVDQWKQDQANIVEQLRFLQLTSRDTGHAEDAAAIAVQVRAIQRGGQPVVTNATADLVHEGLPNRDAPVVMSMFRDHAGETLSFAVRGRDDQPVWGTTTYADDSGLETAAVHAGLLRAGQTGIVKVAPMAGQERYEASNQNGVQSSAYGAQKGSFRFVSVSVVKPVRSSSMSSYRDLVGQSITIPTIGAIDGRVWGTDVYTDDSPVAAAAVHAGVLAPGEFGFVKITLLPGQARYEGSPRNGVSSQNFDAFAGSFRLERASDPGVVQLPAGEDASHVVPIGALRSRPGTSFVVRVVGAEGGTIWGSDLYTDDSSLAVAAVHAGLLKPGEAGLVRVTLEPGRDSYAGSERNGIRSANYGKYPGSYRIERTK